MSVILTSIPPRPLIIDLTDTASASSNYTLTNGRPPPKEQQNDSSQAEGPPLKRRRVDNDWKKQNVACQQASPYVSVALQGFPEERYLRDQIAIQALSIFARDDSFLQRLDESNDYELPLNDQWTSRRAQEIIAELACQPKYHIKLAQAGDDAKPLNGRQQESESPSKSPAHLPAGRQPTELKAEQAKLPERGRSRVWKAPSTRLVSDNTWFSLNQRPYQSAADRELISRGARAVRTRDSIGEQIVYHVDFTADEVKQIIACLSTHITHPISRTVEGLTQLCQQYNVSSLVGTSIPHRTAEDVGNFCSDLLAGTASPFQHGRILKLGQDTNRLQSKSAGTRACRVASLLLAREVVGNRGFGCMRQYENFQNEFSKSQEDGLSLIAEFTNCAGDISTTTWIPDNNILCGTTAHSDSHNQQYNKPGNLLLCSTSLGELRAFPDHRIPRPLVEKGENSTEAMRQSQDPWLYSSVVSSDYDKVHGLAYTSSFDKTVKVWKIDKTGSKMSVVATWHFDGHVNFVVAAMDGSGRVAAAADVPTEAVRIYTVNPDDIASSSYQSFSCSRTDADGSDEWAYFPATMQWGRGRGTQHLLAVGYSPRSLTLEEHDIPEDKRNSGEITLWDAARNCRVPVMTATTANFFEVVWHPTLPRFVAATSPSILKVAPGVRTQVHLFRYQDEAYSEYQNLDCFASDINELTFVPNSVRHAYVTAACTDGKVYVWDTAQGDKPIHILEHGRPLDEYYYDREKEDTGVKFTAWGNTLDRFYTGASDGVVKVWNVRNRQKPYVRTLLEAPGPISCGAFSPDLTKLVIGDATGRVFLFSTDSRDEPEAHFTTVQGVNRRLRRPTPYIPHPDPPPPGCNEDVMEDGEHDLSIAELARQTYLDTRQLVVYPNPTIGVVQGPEYASANLFRRDAHLDDDPSGPLLASYQRHQRETIESSVGTRSRSLRRLKSPEEPNLQLQCRHVVNSSQDFDVERLTEADLRDLIKAGAELSINDVDLDFQYEEMPDE